MRGCDSGRREEVDAVPSPGIGPKPVHVLAVLGPRRPRRPMSSLHINRWAAGMQLTMLARREEALQRLPRYGGPGEPAITLL